MERDKRARVYGGDRGDYTDPHPRYRYQFHVTDPRTGDSKSMHERRDGGGVVGEYRVLEPNGLERIVTYTADDRHGFRARVRWVPAGARAAGPAVSHQEVTQFHSDPVPAPAEKLFAVTDMLTSLEAHVKQLNTAKVGVDSLEVRLQTLEGAVGSGLSSLRASR
ncbi:larval cuticle protein A2B-like [Pollicipes pollicipes]|uniref:larval cuticle protein A2B-like n=1 Tax=Pollicipes pollicipes TaxID=41117 RepID=UPI0018853162|nr:larval cuticle protein A2B-like [Pollicipes pollicipes]